jgi:hypothetical protein
VRAWLALLSGENIFSKVVDIPPRGDQGDKIRDGIMGDQHTLSVNE